MKFVFSIIAIALIAICFTSTPESHAAPAGCSGATLAASCSGVASCSGSTEVQSLLFSRKPVRSFLSKVQERRASRIAARASCSGSLVSQSCGGSSVASCNGL